jgi:hypothetical protein
MSVDATTSVNVTVAMRVDRCGLMALLRLTLPQRRARSKHARDARRAAGSRDPIARRPGEDLWPAAVDVALCAATCETSVRCQRISERSAPSRGRRTGMRRRV